MTEVLSENYGNEPEDCCPKCKGQNLDFGVQESCDSGSLFPVTCPDCGFEGQQHYNLVFVCYTDDETGEEL